MFTSASVPPILQAIIGGYAAHALLTEAKTPHRRKLGRSLGFFSVYSALMFVGYSSSGAVRSIAISTAVFFGGLSGLDLFEATRLSSFHDRAAKTSHALRRVLVLIAGAALVHATARATDTGLSYSLLLIVCLLGQLAALVMSLLGWIRRVPIADLNGELRRQVAARSRQLQSTVGPSPSSSGLVVGDLIGERYWLIRVLGMGGMGVVYEVEDTARGGRVALKMMTEATSREELGRFAREAEIAATVAHPKIVRVLDVGVHAGAPYLVMELVTSGSLDQARGRFADPASGLPILRDVAEALAALHASGIVHRDLKPANVLLEETAAGVTARLTDFGIARNDIDVFGATMKDGGSSPALTATGVMMGTIPYMAPEAAAGVNRLSGKADVFALGLMAYELFDGQLPFKVPPIIEALGGRPLPLPVELPGKIPVEARQCIALCLRESPEDRPSANEAARSFAQAATVAIP
jgi:eukaryotic-like serine/threonine-protein kinase